MASLLVGVSRFLARYQSGRLPQTGHSSIRWQSTGRSGFWDDWNSTSSFGQNAADASGEFGGSQGTSSWYAYGGFAGDQIGSRKSQQYSVARGTPVRENLRGARQSIPIPDQAPFGLNLLRIGNLKANHIMYLFRAHNPIRVRMLPGERALILFRNRDDLVAALELDQKEEVHWIRVLPSIDLYNISKMDASGHFMVCLTNFPRGCTRTDLEGIFKEYNPIPKRTSILINQKTNLPFALMNLTSKEDVINAFDASGASCIQRIVVQPGRKTNSDSESWN